MPTRPLVLLVDDQHAERVRLYRALQRSGHSVDVVACSDGRNAIDWLSRARRMPDLIVTGLKMHRVSGERLLTSLSASPPLSSIPAVVLSSEDDPVRFATIRRRYNVTCLHRPGDLIALHDLAGALVDLLVRRRDPIAAAC